MTRRFHLLRIRDVSGVSGTGIVANGVEWPDGTVTVRWRGVRPSTVNWNSMGDVKAIHGHGGATVIVWEDGVATDADGAIHIGAELRSICRKAGVDFGSVQSLSVMPTTVAFSLWDDGEDTVITSRRWIDVE